jgi:hypothetical protein
MKNNNERIEHIMASLDGIQRAEANPYLLTRINQAIANGKIKTQQSPKWLTGLAFVLVLFIAANVYTYFSMNKNNTPSTKQGIEAFASEYELTGETTLN